VVTDPPYELGFMGKAWDGSGVAYDVDLWAEVLRVLKPGGHLCAFGGTRTYHRMACAIEDAGFEIRDSLHWVYGSGFPKSLDVSKAIDKAGGVSPADQAAVLRNARERAGLTREEVAEAVGATVSSVRDWEEGRARTSGGPVEYLVPCDSYRTNLADLLGYTADERRVTGGTADRRGDGTGYSLGHSGTLTEGGNTNGAKQWSGWGTALKPAHEPIVVARKPLDGTVAANVLTHGTGALNIDGTRVGSTDGFEKAWDKPVRTNIGAVPQNYGIGVGDGERHTVDLSANKPTGGRWPANVIFDTEAGALLDEQSGVSKDGVAIQRNGGGQSIWGADNRIGSRADAGYGGQGGASRFFTAINWEPEIDVPFRYVPKPSKRERNAGLEHLPEQHVRRHSGGEYAHNSGSTSSSKNGATLSNHHPTVKPLALMRWLVKLVTPPGGTVLEPFAGSGTTLMACVMEGFNGIGIELTDEYLPIIRGRVAWAEQQAQQITDSTDHVQETLPL
jgi:site-specific DNA-methyltransferase (adenine-specific)